MLRFCVESSGGRMEAQIPQQLDFSTDTDSDLLGYMAMRAEDPEVATQAWAQFYDRHGRYLYAVLKKRGYADRLGGEELLEDLSQDTFRRAFERAETFNDPGVSDPNALRMLVRTWLSSISQNLFLDQLRAAAKDPMEDSLGEDVLESRPMIDTDKEIDSEIVNLGIEAWDKVLDERDQEVLRAFADFGKPGGGFQRMSSGVARALADSIGTTTAGMRMRKMRAIDKIRSYVEERLKQRKPS